MTLRETHELLSDKTTLDYELKPTDCAIFIAEDGEVRLLIPKHDQECVGATQMMRIVRFLAAEDLVAQVDQLLEQETEED